MLTEWGRRIAGMFDLPQGALAEAFRVVETG